MPDVVPLRIKILRNPDKTMNYPDFKSLAVFDDPNYEAPDWHTDRSCDVKHSAPHSPVGLMWGIKLVDVAFAQQALAAFPARVSVMTESEAETFWNVRVKATLSGHKRHESELLGMKAELELRRERGMPDTHPRMVKLFAEIDAALDPQSSKPGVVGYKDATWAKMKASRELTIVALP